MRNVEVFSYIGPFLISPFFFAPGSLRNFGFSSSPGRLVFFAQLPLPFRALHRFLEGFSLGNHYSPPPNFFLTSLRFFPKKPLFPPEPGSFPAFSPPFPCRISRTSFPVVVVRVLSLWLFLISDISSHSFSGPPVFSNYRFFFLFPVPTFCLSFFIVTSLVLFITPRGNIFCATLPYPFMPYFF